MTAAGPDPIHSVEITPVDKAFADRLGELFAACRKHSRVRDYFRGVDMCDACLVLADECDVLVAVEALEPDR